MGCICGKSLAHKLLFFSSLPLNFLFVAVFPQDVFRSSSVRLFLLCSVSCDRERENFPIPAFPHPALICQGLVLFCIICASGIRLCFRSTQPHACEVSQSKLGHGSMASALHLNPLPLPYKSLSKSKLKDNLVLILH